MYTNPFMLKIHVEQKFVDFTLTVFGCID